MDDPALEPGRLAAAFDGIERLNRWSSSAQILWRPLQSLLRAHPGKCVRVLDVGTGSGDLPLALWQRAQRDGFNVALDGVDVSRTAVELARERAARHAAPLQFMQANALRDNIPDGYDVVMSSLFLHHLADDEAQSLLGRMAAAAQRLVLVNDLARGRAGLMLAYAATRLATRSAVVRVDGPRSVRGAFTPAEAAGLAARAGMRGARVERCWPCRWRLTWWRA